MLPPLLVPLLSGVWVEALDLSGIHSPNAEPHLHDVSPLLLHLDPQGMGSGLLSKYLGPGWWAPRNLDQGALEIVGNWANMPSSFFPFLDCSRLLTSCSQLQRSPRVPGEHSCWVSRCSLQTVTRALWSGSGCCSSLLCCFPCLSFLSSHLNHHGLATSKESVSTLILTTSSASWRIWAETSFNVYFVLNCPDLAALITMDD